MRSLQVADLFCGAGGSSTGARRALKRLGLEMELLCVNHWPVAIETHKRNHPTQGGPAMKIIIESTPKIVELRTPGGSSMQARVWQGETEGGVPVQVFVTRIAPEISVDDPDIDTLTEQFERELRRQADPRPTVQAIPLRVII